jgi:hypothetical protein
MTSKKTDTKTKAMSGTRAPEKTKAQATTTTETPTTTSARASGGLADKLAQVDTLLTEKNPAAKAALKPGASDASLAKLAKTIGAAVPEDLAAFFRWHDGESRVASLQAGDNRTPMSIAGAIDAWMFLSDPSEDILQPWKRTWVPIFENGAGDHLCFDLKGGALVEYWHADEDRGVAFPSLAAWADATIAALREAKPPAPVAERKKVTLDAAGATWTQIAKPPAEKHVAKKAVGSVLWYRKPLVEGEPPCMYLFVKVEPAGDKPWRKVENKELDLAGAFAHLQQYFDRENPPPDDWWKAGDWDVAYACDEEAFSEEDPAPDGLFEGAIHVRVG